MKNSFTVDGQSMWVDLRGLDIRADRLPSIAGSGTWGGGTLKIEISFEDDKSNPFLYGTGLTADGVEAINLAGVKWARLDLTGSTTPTLTGYLNF